MFAQQRLDKLETDLQLLITMHDLFLESDTESVIDDGRQSAAASSSSWPDEIPERDTTHKKKDNNKTLIPANVPLSKCEEIAKKDEPSEATQLSKLNRELTEEIALVKARCKEVEESAKHVYIQLQKVQDEARKEKEMKEAAMLESFRLKVTCNEYQAELEKLKGDSAVSKAELEQFELKIQSLSTEKANIIQKLFYLCQEMGYDKERAGYDHHFLMRQRDDMIYFDYLKNKLEELKKRCSGENEVKRLTSQANILVGRCATLEKERNTLKAQLLDTQDREGHLKNQLNMCQMTVTTAESEVLKKQIEYECFLQKIQSEATSERNKFTQKLNEYSSLIKKSKELLVNMKRERDQSRQQLQSTLNSQSFSESQLKSLNFERYQFADELEKTKHQLCQLSQLQLEKDQAWQAEKVNMSMSLKRVTCERRKCLNLLTEMKNQLVSLKAKAEHDLGMMNIEKERILNENKRLDENARVLQKISEDNGHTIGKLRSEIEDLKRINFKLDSQIRDYESNENSLIRKLEQAEKQCDRYCRRVDELEEKIRKFEANVREHDCDEYVDSKYKQKVKELESLLKNKQYEWQDNLNDIAKEKEQALAMTRESLQKTEEMKKLYESKLVEMKTKIQAEMARVNDTWRKKDDEKLSQIRDLQSKLDRLNLSSSQIQQALSTKIKQLQAALGICLGGSAPHQNSLGSMSPSHIHQLQNAPAFQNARGGGRSSSSCCVNGNAAPNLLNVHGGQTECHTCFTFDNPPVVLVGECTSAEFTTQPCTTTAESFDAASTDLFDSLML